MNISLGKILVSTSSTDDPVFYEALIFITEFNDEGALGFIFNKQFERNFNELAEFIDSPRFPIYDGGPVDKEHLYFIHRRSDCISGGVHVIDDIYFGGDFTQAVKLINSKKISTADIKLFIGYCGWDANDLETEIAAGDWEMEEYQKHILFSE